MFYNGKDSMKEKLALQHKYKKAFRMPKRKGKLLYHYAGLETAWKILDSDVFLARNIRFSNDSEEYKRGGEIVKEYVQETMDDDQKCRELEEKMYQGIQMYYMVCFCEDGDLLSQWRGYAKDGVSFGMDFLEELAENAQIFTVLNNSKNRGDDEKERYKSNDEYLRLVEMPYQVFYTKEKLDRSLREALNCFDDDDLRLDMIFGMIPFIKNQGFHEEAEYRILFDMGSLGKTEAENRVTMAKKIEYLEKDRIKLPNIAIEIGDGEKKEKEVEYITVGKQLKKMYSSSWKSIKQFLKEKMKKYRISCEFDEKRDYIYIGEGKNQEEIMRVLEETLQQNGIPIDFENGVKIWCRGHLPIREIIIGPGVKQEKLNESIKHFARNTYWLRYADIKNSRLPLQE